MKTRITTFFSIRLLEMLLGAISLLCACSDGGALKNPARPSQNPPPGRSGPSTPLDTAEYALEVAKGNRQRYRGGQSCPQPIVIRLYNYQTQTYLAANSPSDALLRATIQGPYGRLSHSFESFGNYCGPDQRICFGAHYFAPRRDSAYDLELQLRVVHSSSGEHISGSPFTITHHITAR